jgi:hypothetical protein
MNPQYLGNLGALSFINHVLDTHLIVAPDFFVRRLAHALLSLASSLVPSPIFEYSICADIRRDIQQRTLRVVRGSSGGIALLIRNVTLAHRRQA